MASTSSGFCLYCAESDTNVSIPLRDFLSVSIKISAGGS